MQTNSSEILPLAASLRAFERRRLFPIWKILEYLLLFRTEMLKYTELAEFFVNSAVV